MISSQIRDQFPIFKQPIRGHRLAYLDSAATTQKPQSVIDSLTRYYQEANANIHRGVHYLSEIATVHFENARETIREFINAKESHECIFVKSATEGINLVATSFGNAFVQAGDEIIVSMMEHHSNFVPWQMLCSQKNAILKFLPMNKNGELEIEALHNLLTEKTKLLAISHASNALGTRHPIEEIIQIAHARQVPVLVDGAQTAPHLSIDVQALDCDFFVFSGHKTYGPTGIGVLYGKTKWLEKMPPYQGGGEMIKKVSLHETIYQDLPHKFEAGTPPIASVIGLEQAVKFLSQLGFQNIQNHEVLLLKKATEMLSSFPEIDLIGDAKEKIGILSFTMKGVHPHDIGTLADQQGVALRTGHHCAMPIMDFLNIPGTARISFGVYNTLEDIEQLRQAILFIKQVFKIH